MSVAKLNAVEWAMRDQQFRRERSPSRRPPASAAPLPPPPPDPPAVDVSMLIERAARADAGYNRDVQHHQQELDELQDSNLDGANEEGDAASAVEAGEQQAAQAAGAKGGPAPKFGVHALSASSAADHVRRMRELAAKREEEFHTASSRLVGASATRHVASLTAKDESELLERLQEAPEARCAKLAAAARPSTAGPASHRRQRSVETLLAATARPRSGDPLSRGPAAARSSAEVLPIDASGGWEALHAAVHSRRPSDAPAHRLHTASSLHMLSPLGMLREPDASELAPAGAVPHDASAEFFVNKRARPRTAGSVYSHPPISELGALPVELVRDRTAPTLVAGMAMPRPRTATVHMPGVTLQVRAADADLARSEVAQRAVEREKRMCVAPLPRLPSSFLTHPRTQRAATPRGALPAPPPAV
jgi:hypothetical protein